MLRQINPAARIRSAMLTYAPRFGIRMIINNKQASNKLLNMQSTLSQTTPWSFGLFLMVTTVPAFYFLHQLLLLEYSDQQFVVRASQFCKYVMANNVISFASSLSLAHLGFNAPTTKNAAMIFRVRRYYLTIPIILCCLGFMLPETDSKYMVITPCLTQLSVSFFEIVIMDQSRIPFWLYSFRHYVNLFYLTGLLICYFGVSNRAKRRLSHPHQFVLDVKMTIKE